MIDGMSSNSLDGWQCGFKTISLSVNIGRQLVSNTTFKGCISRNKSGCHVVVHQKATLHLDLYLKSRGARETKCGVLPLLLIKAVYVEFNLDNKAS